MLHGKELGRAIELAIQLKLESGKAGSKIEIARAFGVKPPSLHTWIKSGSIGKQRLPKLWAYFSDVVGLDHWGFTPEAIAFLRNSADNTKIKEEVVTWPFALSKAEDVMRLSPEELERLDSMIAGYLLGAQGSARKSKPGGKSAA